MRETAEALVDGRFELIALAGSGGMGEVFRARDRLTGRVVALKLLREGAREGGDARRFAREAQVLAGIAHEGIVAHVAHGFASGGHGFLAMEWLDGEDLARRLRRGPLSPAETWRLGARVAEALAAAHARGVVHRDIKPTNLFLCDGEIDRVKVLDFGIARPLGNTPTLTRTGLLIGTPEYMSPEQARADRVITPAADVFSLGCVLFECLAGRSPFKAEHVAAVLMRILLEEPPPVTSLRAGVPDGLAELLAAMLHKDPSRRPRDGEALHRAFAALGAPPQGGADAAGREPPSTALADVEQRYLSVILAVVHPAHADTMEGAAADRARSHCAKLRSELSARGCDVEYLADGSIVATLPQDGERTAVDQAAQAARCAFLIRERWPHALIALVTSRGTLRAGLPSEQALDLAARLVAAAPDADADDVTGGAIRVDEVTAGLIDGRFDVVKQGSSYVLRGERDDVDGVRLLLGRPAPCVGREQELAMLDATFVGAVEEGARAVLITAPPGVGKTRLRHEFVRRLRARRPDVTVFVGRGDPMSAGASYGLLARALRDACEVREGRDLAASEGRLRARVGRHLAPQDAPRVTAFLAELCGIPRADDGDVALRVARQTRETVGDQIQRAFLDLLRAECGAQPVVLILEDLHWGDALTVRLCDAALRDLRDQSLLVVALARPEVRELFPRLWEGRAWQALSLGGLRRRACEQIVRAALGPDVAPDVLQRVIDRAEGNALYLEELVRAVAAGKGDTLPETVLAMLQARLMRLPAETRRVLRAASVMGETFWPGGVAALLGAPSADALHAELAALVDAELIERHPSSRLAGEAECGFRHALMRDASYALLSEEDRALAHRVAGEWLERVGERDALVMAEHFALGRDLWKAGRYYALAAEEAHRMGNASVVIHCAEEALACELPDRTRVALKALIAEEMGWLLDFNRAVALSEEALRESAPGSVAWASAIAYRAASAGLNGRGEEFAALVERICAATPEPNAIAPAAFAMMAAAYVSFMRGERVLAEKCARRQGAITEPLGEAEPLGHAWHLLTRGFVDTITEDGPFSALGFARRGFAAFAAVGNNRGALLCQIVIGLNLVALGRFAEGEAALRSTYVPDVVAGPLGLQRTTALLRALCAQGALDEAERVVQESLAAFSHKDGLEVFGEGFVRASFADVLCLRGDLERAEAEARASFELMAGFPGDRLEALTSLACAQLLRGRAADARASASAALRGYAELRLLAPSRARARLVNAEALLALGERERARGALAEAREALLDAARRVDDEALRESFLRAVPEHARTLELAARVVDGPDDG